MPKLGAYVSIVPSESDCEIDSTETGYNDVQNINPQELKLWRVINVNDDWTLKDGLTNYSFDNRDSYLYSHILGNFIDSTEGTQSASIRPIVTLKAGLKYSGSGTKNDLLTLSTK